MYNLNKLELQYLLTGYSLANYLADDDLVSKCGYLSRPAFSSSPLRWYWDWETDKSQKLTLKDLMSILKLIKGKRKKILKGKEEKHPPLPLYVMLNNTTALRLDGNVYLRDAGSWDVGYKFLDGKLVTDSHIDSLNNVPLFAITRAKYKKDNKGFLPENY